MNACFAFFISMALTSLSFASSIMFLPPQGKVRGVVVEANVLYRIVIDKTKAGPMLRSASEQTIDAPKRYLINFAPGMYQLATSHDDRDKRSYVMFGATEFRVKAKPIQVNQEQVLAVVSSVNKPYLEKFAAVARENLDEVHRLLDTSSKASLRLVPASQVIEAGCYDFTEHYECTVNMMIGAVIEAKDPLKRSYPSEIMALAKPATDI
jgi:hypothetical protein